MQAVAIGVDVGGTAIKGAAVDPRTGARLTSRHRVETPTGGTPEAVARAVATMVADIRHELAEIVRGGSDYSSCASTGSESDSSRKETPDLTDGVNIDTTGADNATTSAIVTDSHQMPIADLPIGVTLPGVVRHGIMSTAANVDISWIGVDATALFSDAVGAPCSVVNDADAAGVAESAFGAAKNLPGMTMVLTFGTGIGSACLYNGVLVPNFELGHLQLGDSDNIEEVVAPKVIQTEGVTLHEWADRAAGYVRHLEHVLSPDRFIIGGSISKDSASYLPFAGVTVPVIPANFRNDAGIVGAAALAAGTAR